MTKTEIETAEQNPFGVSPWVLGAGVAVVGVGGFVVSRLVCRGKLRGMLEDSDMVKKATELSLISWTPAEKAAEEIHFLTLKTPNAAYVDVLAELQKLLPIEPSDLVNLTDDAKRMFEEKTGVNVDAVTASVYESLPDVPLIDTSSLYSWWTGK